MSKSGEHQQELIEAQGGLVEWKWAICLQCPNHKNASQKLTFANGDFSSRLWGFSTSRNTLVNTAKRYLQPFVRSA